MISLDIRMAPARDHSSSSGHCVQFCSKWTIISLTGTVHVEPRSPAGTLPDWRHGAARNPARRVEHDPLLQFFCTCCPCQPNAATMRATAGVIVDHGKTPEINAEIQHHSNVTQMADAPDSESGPRKRVWVQVPPSELQKFDWLRRLVGREHDVQGTSRMGFRQDVEQR